MCLPACLPACLAPSCIDAVQHAPCSQFVSQCVPVASRHSHAHLGSCRAGQAFRLAASSNAGLSVLVNLGPGLCLHRAGRVCACPWPLMLQRMTVVRPVNTIVIPYALLARSRTEISSALGSTLARFRFPSPARSHPMHASASCLGPRPPPFPLRRHRRCRQRIPQSPSALSCPGSSAVVESAMGCATQASNDKLSWG